MRVTELKGQRHEIFDFRGFFPQAPKYTIKAISNFFKNFRRNLQICHRCRWYNGAPWFANISANFSKNIEITLTLFSGAWGKMIHEKNLKQKISWHCPFQLILSVDVLSIIFCNEVSEPSLPWRPQVIDLFPKECKWHAIREIPSPKNMTEALNSLPLWHANSSPNFREEKNRVFHWLMSGPVTGGQWLGTTLQMKGRWESNINVWFPFMYCQK
jgi:hypothetical protein